MKTKLRRISFVMIMVLLFATIPLYNGERNTLYFAAENQEDNIPEGMKSDEEMMDLALEYFPEYFEKIKHPVQLNSSQAREISSQDTLVINESKKISDNEQIIYQEYASGRANILFIVDEDIVLTQNGSGHQMYRSLNIQVYSLFLSGSMYIIGFAYTIYYDQYDLINSFGDTRASYLPINMVETKVNENANGPATATYSAVFEYPEGSFMGGLIVSCALKITVGNNEYTAVAY